MRKNTIIMILVKGLSLLISLMYVPMMLKAVNRVDYGVLLTLTSVAHWIAMLDIGLGHGLRNKLTEYLAKRDILKARQCVSSTYAFLGIYISALCILFILISPFCSWCSLLNVPDGNERELWMLANVVVVAFCLQFFAGLINSILYAYQWPSLTSILMLVSQAITFVIAFIMINCFGISSILCIGALTCSMPPLCLLGGSVFLFRNKLREVAPSFKMVCFDSIKGILSLGFRFFFLQIITIVLFQANNIIIAHTVAPESVVEYNIAYKYVGLITVLFTFVITPAWSAVTDAYVRGDIEWIKKTVVYLWKICAGVIVFGLVMTFISPYVYVIWLGKDTIHIPYITTLLILVFIAFEMFYKIYVSVINGIGKLQVQMIITPILALLFIPLSCYMGKAYGLSGVLLANCVIHGLNFVWIKIQYGMIIEGKAKGIWNR